MSIIPRRHPYVLERQSSPNNKARHSFVMGLLENINNTPTIGRGAK